MYQYSFSYCHVMWMHPHSGLDLSKYMMAPEQPKPVYDLFAVTNHFGGMEGGHCEWTGGRERERGGRGDLITLLEEGLYLHTTLCPLLLQTQPIVRTRTQALGINLMTVTSHRYQKTELWYVFYVHVHAAYKVPLFPLVFLSSTHHECMCTYTGNSLPFFLSHLVRECICPLLCSLWQKLYHS